LVGHQIGSGSGQTAATIAGAAGGALAGHAIENRQAANAQQVYRVTLRMDDGSVQNLIQESAPTLRIGDRVRVVNGVVERL
jgi:outer membrane lipoprotein SlyB